MNKSRSEKFIELAKNKTKELGYNITQTALDHMNGVITLLQSSIGNELVLATFVPMIPSLLADEVKRKIFGKEISDLGQKLNSVRNQLNLDFIKTDEGRRIFQTLIDEMMTNAEEKKITHLKQFIVFSYTQEKPDELLLRNYRRILLQMDSTHLQLLSAMVNPSKIIQKCIDSKKNPDMDQMHIPGVFNGYLLNFPREIFNTVHNDLKNWGILTEIEGKREEQGVYTLQSSFWTKGHLLSHGQISKKHSKKFLEENITFEKPQDAVKQLVPALTCIVLNHITEFGWDFWQSISSESVERKDED